MTNQFLTVEKQEAVQTKRTALRASQGIIFGIFLLVDGPVALLVLLAILFEKWIGALILAGIGGSIYLYFSGTSRFLGQTCELLRLVDCDLTSLEAEKLKAGIEKGKYASVIKHFTEKVGTDEDEKYCATEVITAVNNLRSGFYTPKAEILTIDAVDIEEKQ